MSCAPELREIAIEQLVPVQSIIDPEKLRKFIGPQLPIEIMFFEGEGSDRTKYLLLDGHHRAYRELELGQETSWAYIYTDDEQAQAARAPLLKELKTMDAVREWFRSSQLKSPDSVSGLLFDPWG